MCEGRVRAAWVMRLKPGNEKVYKEKHDQIWPELLAVMREQGIRNFTIYRHGLLLFAYMERDGGSPSGGSPDPVTRRWWRMMEPYMECNADASPREEPIEEMFHADLGA